MIIFYMKYMIRVKERHDCNIIWLRPYKNLFLCIAYTIKFWVIQYFAAKPLFLTCRPSGTQLHSFSYAVWVIEKQNKCFGTAPVKNTGKNCKINIYTNWSSTRMVALKTEATMQFNTSLLGWHSSWSQTPGLLQSFVHSRDSIY